MALLPRPLRPSWILRRWALYTGMRSSSGAVRFVALLAVGRAAFLRTSATRRGVYGGNRLWQTVAAAFFLNDIVKKLTVKETEVLATDRLRPGDQILVRTLPARSRRGRRSA